MNPEKRRPILQIDPFASTERAPNPESGERTRKALEDEQPTIPQSSRPKKREKPHEAIDQAAEILASVQSASRDKLLEALDTLRLRQEKLSTELQTSFRGNTVEEASQRREIQEALAYVGNAQKKIRSIVLPSEGRAMNHPHIYEEAAGQIAEMQQWLNEKPDQRQRLQKADQWREKLLLLTAYRPANEKDAEQRERTLRAIEELLEELEAPDDAVSVKRRRGWAATQEQEEQDQGFEMELETARQKVIQKYGKPPEQIEAEADFMTQVRITTGNAAAILMGEKEPFAEWRELQVQKKRSQGQRDTSSSTQPAISKPSASGKYKKAS